MNPKRIFLTECPRDAMQGLHQFIPTETKVAYLNQLFKVGFETLDFGSFVSAKGIPQMADTAEVLAQLELGNSTTKLLAIVANTRGAEQSCTYSSIHYLGFPLSLSPTFQVRNTNKTIEETYITLQEIQSLCVVNHKQLAVYLSMGFGNPYGEPYHVDLVVEAIKKLEALGVTYILPSDTIGIATAEQISLLVAKIKTEFPNLQFGVHLHSNPNSSASKIKTAITAGCFRIDSSLNGIGGCPMATDNLTGNIATETVLSVAENMGYSHNLNMKEYQKALAMANSIFGQYK